MGAFIPGNTQQQLRELVLWGKVRQEQLCHAIQISKDTVLGYLKRQLEKGHFEDVLDVLEGKPMTAAGKFLLAELRDRVANNLILQLRIRKALAVTMAIVIMPLVLAKLSGMVIQKFKDITSE